MKYHLALDIKGTPNYQKNGPRLFPIDSKYFQTNEKEDQINPEFYSTKDEAALLKIVEFTTSFDNTMDLKQTLKNNGLKLDLTEGKLVIFSSYKNINKVLPYGIPLKEDFESYDFNNIREYILENKTDVDFLRAITKRFPQGYLPSFSYSMNFIKLRDYIDNYDTFDYLDNDPIDKTISDYLRYIVFDKNHKLRFYNLHTLSGMINKHIKNYDLMELHEPEDEVSLNQRLQHINYILSTDTPLPEEVELLEREKLRIMIKLGLVESEVKKK